MDKGTIGTNGELSEPPPNFGTNTKTKAQFEKCMVNKFEQTDTKKVTDLVTSDAATEDWYKGHVWFNFATGESLAPNAPKLDA